MQRYAKKDDNLIGLWAPQLVLLMVPLLQETHRKNAWNGYRPSGK
jgi:hypothetical protein